MSKTRRTGIEWYVWYFDAIGVVLEWFLTGTGFFGVVLEWYVSVSHGVVWFVWYVWYVCSVFVVVKRCWSGIKLVLVLVWY